MVHQNISPHTLNGRQDEALLKDFFLTFKIFNLNMVMCSIG